MLNKLAGIPLESLTCTANVLWRHLRTKNKVQRVYAKPMILALGEQPAAPVANRERRGLATPSTEVGKGDPWNLGNPVWEQPAAPVANN